jgi:hypothetical protein
MGNRLRSSRNPLIAAGLLALAAFIPRAMTAGHLQNFDELLWMRRTVDFSDALAGLDFSAASAATEGGATMPGVTTMWLGTVARGVWELGGALGTMDAQGSFADSAVGLDLSQLAVAAATSILIGVFVLLAWRWAGAIAAIVGGVLLATEPFFVSNGSMLHTDELTGLFAATGTLALLIALGVAGGKTSRPGAMAALAGALLAGAFLSKLTALLLAPGLAVIVAWALARAVARQRTHGDNSLAAMRPVGGLVGILFAAGIVTTLLAWPAIWADPIDQISVLSNSAGQGGRGHEQFFRGEVTETPGPLYFLVATPLRMTPWFLLATLAMIAAAIVRVTRARLATLAIVAIPAFVGLSLASKQIDRYVLVVLPFLALGVGLGIDALWVRLRHGRQVRKVALSVAGTAAALALAHAVWVAPWGGVYFNPLLGGSKEAERTILVTGTVGWQRAGEPIRDREEPACDVTIAVYPYPLPDTFPCGTAGPPRANPDPDYAVTYVSWQQRNPEQAEALSTSGRIVGTVKIRGINMAEIIDLREQPET